VHHFIAALRQLRLPLVLLAACILALQALVAGLASGQAAARIAGLGPDALVLCHGNGEDGSAPDRAATHDCCVFCTGSAPVVVSASVPVIARLLPERRAGQAENPADIRSIRRAIRAGPSQAPPPVA
jgi:hypothetical protein